MKILFGIIIICFLALALFILRVEGRSLTRDLELQGHIEKTLIIQKSILRTLREP